MNVFEQQIRESLVKDPEGHNLKMTLCDASVDYAYREALVNHMGHTDPRTHTTRVKLLVDLLARSIAARNVAAADAVMPPLLALAALKDAQWVLSSLADIDPTNEHLDQLRAMADRQTHEKLILTGALDYEEIEDAVLGRMTASMVSKEPRRLRIDFDWTFEDGHPACKYHVYEVLGPDPAVHTAVTAFLAENAALVGRAETGEPQDVQELLAKATSYVHDRTGLVDPQATLESLLNQTSLGKRFAKDLTTTES